MFHTVYAIMLDSMYAANTIISSSDSVKEEVKSVDILAALPTPPHNQNEDIRMESDDEDTPETIIPASSPESNVGDINPRFPHLLEPKEEETERAISPIIPVIPRTAIPAQPVAADEAESPKKSTSPTPPSSSPVNIQTKTECEQDVGSAADAAQPVNATESDVPALVLNTEPTSEQSDPPALNEDYKNLVVKEEEDCVTEPVHPPRESPSPMESSPKAIKQRRPLSPDEGMMHPKMKKWKGIRWKRLQIIITIRKGGSKKETSREVSELMDRLRITLRPEKLPRDKRKCCFCHEEGDGATDGPARLLNIDVDLWVHLNCALWSTEVYETQGGALINVEVALRRGLRTLCAYCQKTGATNSCNRLRCPNVYHFACAIRARCMFFKDKTMLCTQHKLKGPSDDELSTFAVLRRVYIERDEVKQIASILQRSDRIHLFRVGGLIFHAIGQLLPSQMANFHSPTAIFPVGYEATRIYWSTRVPNKRCRYRCRIGEDDGRPLFEVRVLEHGMEDLHYHDATAEVFKMDCSSICFADGLGLYAAKDLEKHTMVIEYIGTVIRNEVANRREKIYESQVPKSFIALKFMKWSKNNRGIYMFRINNEQVIDATLTGGPARRSAQDPLPLWSLELPEVDELARRKRNGDWPSLLPQHSCAKAFESYIASA
ncbi:hypothetical protein XENOCAPTIV_002345 [Xenoophorus captivus]|uniref:[histone H3]-lysine(4) N-methyltransferase n=1 Tax=Xenoophorus captivus TaxID=1517983 RepID=A0ABV0RFB8_9TELE